MKIEASARRDGGAGAHPGRGAGARRAASGGGGRRRGARDWVIGVTEMLGPQLPALLDAMADGREHDVLASIAAAAAGLHQGDLSWGLHNGVVCSEWVPHERADNVRKEGRRAIASFPASVLAQAPQFPFLRELCRAWDVPAAPAAQREAARGAIPTLVIAGSYDAITSPAAAQAAAAPLSAATLAAIPRVGHFVVPKSDCAQRVMHSFLADPHAPDLDCLATLKPPPFVVTPR